MPKFGPSEIFRLRHSLVALVEELKFHKKCELDSESKIQELVNRNHAMHKEMDAERQKARIKEEGFERAIRELKLEYENKLRKLDVDKRQKDVKNESKLFAKDRMKEDMRQLQMTIFHHEKTIKELQTKLQAQETSSERAVSQWAGVDKKMSDLTEIYQHTLDSVNRLEQGVVKAVSMNRQLSYRNHHHDCLMKEQLSEMGRLQQELLQAKIEASAPSLDECRFQEMRSTMDVLQSKIHMLETQGQKQNEALTEQTERARVAINNLKTAQELVTRHLDAAAKCRAEASQLSAECAAQTAQCTALREQLSIGQGLLLERDMAIKTAMEDWQQKESQLEAAITSKDVRLQSLEQSTLQLEETNRMLLERNDQLSQRLLETVNTKCISTSDIGILAGSSVVCMTDISLQVSPDVRSLPTQTSQHMDTTSTQTSQHMNTILTQNTVDVKSITNHTLPDVNIITTCASPAGSTTRATQTSGLPEGHDMLQPYGHETDPSCVQIDASTTCPSSAQIIPPFRANRAADTDATLTKSLPRVTADPRMLALTPVHGFLDKLHGATRYPKPVHTIQLFSESFTAEWTPGTVTKSPSRVACNPHASEFVQGTSEKYQIEAGTCPGSAHAQPASTTGDMSAHTGHTVTEAQPIDGADYRSVDQEWLDRHQGSNEHAMCLLTVETPPMFTGENTSLQDHPRSPPDIDTSGPGFESSQDKHQAHDNPESSMNITQTDELYTQEAAGAEKCSLPRFVPDLSSSLSYTQHHQNNVVKQLPCFSSTRVPHALADDVNGQQGRVSCSQQNITAEIRNANHIDKWKETSPPMSSNVAGQTSQEADRYCYIMGAALFNTDDGDKSARDGGDTLARGGGDTPARDGADTPARGGDVDLFHIKQEICTSQADVSQTWLDRPSLQGQVCQVSTGMPSCNSWCCSSTSDGLLLLHRESHIDGSVNATSMFDNNNNGKPNSSETPKMIDNINDHEEKISKPVPETPPWPDSTNNDVKINVTIGETHTLTEPTHDYEDEKIDIDVGEASSLTDNSLALEKVHVNETHTVIDNVCEDNNKMVMNVTKTHVLTDSRQDDDDEKINVSVMDISTDNSHDDKQAQIPVSERQACLKDTDSLMAAGRFEKTGTPSRTSSTAFSYTDSTHRGILASPGCSQIPLSSTVLNVAHTTPDNLLQCRIPTSIIPFEHVGEDQYLNVAHGDILPTRDVGFGKARPHAVRLNKQAMQLTRTRVRKISLPQSVFIVDVHLNWSVTADYKIIYQHDGTASIQESTVPAQTGSGGTTSNQAQISDIHDNCATAATSLHSSSGCIVKGVSVEATSCNKHPTSYIANVSGSACLSQTGHKGSSKQDKKLTQDVSEQIRSQVGDPYNFLATENVLPFPGATLEVPEHNLGQVRDPYDFHTAENLVSSATVKPAAGYTRAAPRSLKLSKHCRVSGTSSLACLRSPFLSSLGVSSGMITRADLVLSDTFSPDLLKSQSVAKASDALMPSQVHVKTESLSNSKVICDMSSHSRVICDTSLSMNDPQCSQTSSVGSSDCQQLLSHQSSQLFIDATSQYLTNLTPQFLTNQTSSCGSNIFDKCGLQTKSSNTINTTTQFCSVDEKKPGEHSPGDHTNSQQTGICSDRSQVQSKGEHTPQSGDTGQGWPMLPSRIHTARNISHKVVSRGDPGKGGTKLKGILKGPNTGRPKSSTCKSVRFPLELVQHTHDLTRDMQRPCTPLKRRGSSLRSSEDLGTTEHNISADDDPSGSAAGLEASAQSNPESCSQHKMGNSTVQAISSYTDPKLSSQHTHGSCTSLATDADISTNDENTYAISGLATSPHMNPSSSGQHTYVNSQSLDVKGDPNTRDKYGNCRSLALPTVADPSSSSPFTCGNSTYLTNSGSPARSPTASTSWDPSASEAMTQPVLIVPESPYLQLSSTEQEILSTPDDAPAGSQSPDTVVSSQISRYLRSYVFETINSSPLLKDNDQGPAVKKQKTS